MKRQIGNPIVRVDGPITMDHIAPDPMTFPSKRALSRYCNEHNLQAAVLL
jgi:hypothetical protein